MREEYNNVTKKSRQKLCDSPLKIIAGTLNIEGRCTVSR